MPEIAAIVLAAGASSRLGQPKQLVMAEGEPLLHRTARLALEAGCAPVIVVLGWEAERMRPAVSDLPVHAVVNEAWSEGMGTSLSRGVRRLLEGWPKSRGVAALVCDQPRLTVAHLRELLDRHRMGQFPITASVYRGRSGVPAVFAAEVFPELLAAEGDRGARDLIRQKGGRVQTVSWAEGALDLDTPGDLARWSLQ